MWYGNGQKKEEGIIYKVKEVGQWTYYKDDGSVDKILEHN